LGDEINRILAFTARITARFSPEGSIGSLAILQKEMRRPFPSITAFAFSCLPRAVNKLAVLAHFCAHRRIYRFGQ
jgi:hypothetical protein